MAHDEPAGLDRYAGPRLARHSTTRWKRSRQPTPVSHPDAGVCTYFPCIASFWDGTGYMAECADGNYSMSGGLTGACSRHGGELRPVDI